MENINNKKNIENIDNKNNIERKTRAKALSEKIVNAFKSLWIGENEVNAKEDGPFSEEDFNKFNKVYEDLMIKKESYLTALKTDGNLNQAIEGRDRRKTKTIQRDRADD